MGPKFADNILAADDGNGTNDENKASVDIGSVSQPINLSNELMVETQALPLMGI